MIPRVNRDQYMKIVYNDHIFQYNRVTKNYVNAKRQVEWRKRSWVIAEVSITRVKTAFSPLAPPI